MALGAHRGEVVWMVMRGVLRLSVMGVVVGVQAGWEASRLVASRVDPMVALRWE
jgi:hypothetical protein